MIYFLLIIHLAMNSSSSLFNNYEMLLFMHELKNVYLDIIQFTHVLKCSVDDDNTNHSAFTEEVVFLKYENTFIESARLMNEACILHELIEETEISQLHWCDMTNEYIILIINSYESSLKALFNQAYHQFNLKIMLLLTEQLISWLELLHFRFIIHENLTSDTLTLSSLSWQHHQMFVMNFEDTQKCNKRSSSYINLQALSQLLIYLCGTELLWTEFQVMKHEKYWF